MIAAESTSAVQNASGKEIGSPAQGTAEEKSTRTPTICKDDSDASTSCSTSTSIYYQHSTTNTTPHATPTAEGEAAKEDGGPVPLVPLDNSTRICTRELLSFSLKHSKGSIK
jgi:hypothetical protein